MKKQITVEIDPETFSVLNKYGFDFEKNIGEYLDGVTEEIYYYEMIAKLSKKAEQRMNRR